LIPNRKRTDQSYCNVVGFFDKEGKSENHRKISRKEYSSEQNNPQMA